VFPAGLNVLPAREDVVFGGKGQFASALDYIKSKASWLLRFWVKIAVGKVILHEKMAIELDGHEL